MAYKTIALTGTETKVDISGQNCDIRNDGTGVVYVSAEAGITAGADGVLSIPAGGAAKLLDSGGTVHLLGTGSVLLCGNDYAELVFKTAATSSGEGGTEDLVARNAIEVHTSNSAIHLTAEQLNTAVAAVEQSANSYTDSQTAATLKAAKEYADGISGGTGGVSQTYVDNGDSATLTAAKAYADSAVKPVADAVDVLNGTGDGSVSKTVADGIAQIIADAPEDLDTLKEISDWIAAHPADVAAMNAAIAQNTSDITENAAAIAEVNSADSGILAQANTYTNTKSAETLNAAKEYADSISGGGSITVDSGLSADSENPVQNKAVTAALAGKANSSDVPQLIVGTDAASLDNCPEGAWYGQYS